METDQASNDLIAAVSAAVDVMTKAENSFLAYGDAELANEISAVRTRLEDAARISLTGQDVSSADGA